VRIAEHEGDYREPRWAESFGPRAPQGANVTLSALPAGTLVEPVVLASADGALSRGLFYRPPGRMPRAGVHLMHPRTDQSLNYNIPPLVRAGYAVLGRAGRAVNNDVDTVHEEMLLDVAAGVRLLRDSGCEQVVLLGNSGGGSLACLYQSQALTVPGSRLPPQPYTPADLRAADLPAADGLALIGIHLGEGRVLQDMLDPSVTDERDPFGRDPELDMYDPRNGFRIPLAGIRYDPAFIERYRDAQRQRVRRLDEAARAALDAQSAAASELAALAGDAPLSRRLELERLAAQVPFLTIYRTTADPAMVDLTIDPDDRIAGGHDGHQRPDLQNWSTAGFARYLTPRAWLSTWSAESSHASTLRSLAAVTSPTLVVHYAGDVYARMRDARAITDAGAAADKAFVVVRNADHYGRPANSTASSAARVTEGTDVVAGWMTSRFPLTA
jgi:hypothetical protein